MDQQTLLHVPPDFCQYASGPCDQDFSYISSKRALFLYAREPESIAATIKDAAERLSAMGDETWVTWQDLDVSGRIIFCEICKALRGAEAVYADVTTLNFNLLFEIGFCIGLGVPVRPIRDRNYSVSEKDFKALGVLDTLGYIDFTNVEGLVSSLSTLKGPTLGHPAKKTYLETPLYLLKGPVDTEGTVRLISTLKKSPLNFRMHDPAETPRVSFYSHWKEVHGSFGVVASLLSPQRKGALVHNGLCAFLCGIAVAENKAVLMLQEEEDPANQPIDYRDVVKTWHTHDQISRLVAPFITQTIELIQGQSAATLLRPEGTLERLDLGAPAAENEIAGLDRYFVPTGQSRLAAQGHARLVVGRKGSGKTAIFYGVRRAVQRGRQTLVLDMRPEGHQFTRLREAVLEELSEGMQEYTISAFWAYLLTAEIAHKILNYEGEYRAAQRDPARFDLYEDLQKAYLAHGLASGDDLSQRLLRQIDRIAGRFDEAGEVTSRSDLTELVYGGDIRTLNNAVAEYVSSEKDAIWLLIDNLDKSMATRGATTEDLLILRGLLDATAKLEKELANRGVEFRCLVFIRTDVLDRLQKATPDRGKDTVISVDWDDPELFREIIRQRVVASLDLDGSFQDVWGAIAEPVIGTEDSFNYMVDRTLMRPRDLLLFTQQAVQVAINRGHDRVRASDIRHAENGYSEEALLWLGYEIDDTHPGVSDALLAFHGSKLALSSDEVLEVLKAGGVGVKNLDEVVDLLLWFGFLGTRMPTGDELYAHTVRFNLRRLTHPIEQRSGQFVVHPAFRAALAIS